jgi:hypothetical protein
MKALAERLYWEIGYRSRWLYRYLGWGVIAGLLAAAGAAALWPLAAQLESERLALAHAPIASPLPAQTSQQQHLAAVQAGLDRFYGYLPHDDAVPGILSGILELGGDEGLLLSTGDYQRREEPAGGFVRYHITLPIQGDAGLVQQFLLDALAQHPSLSLESVAFKRQSVETGDVESRIRLVLLTGYRGRTRVAGVSP